MNFPTLISGMLMSIVHGIINFFLPSGIGQAVAWLAGHSLNLFSYR